MNIPLSIESSDEYSKPEYQARSTHGNAVVKREDASQTLEKNNFLPLRSDAEHTKLLHELKSKCIEFTELEFGWDGYKAIPVQTDKANIAISIIERLVKPFVPKPSIVPAYDGSIQIEWHVKKYELEIEVTKLTEVEGLIVDRKTDEMHEFSVSLLDEENFYHVLSGYVLKLLEK